MVVQIPVTLHVPRDLWLALKESARLAGRPLKALVAEAIQDKLTAATAAGLRGVVAPSDEAGREAQSAVPTPRRRSPVTT